MLSNKEILDFTKLFTEKQGNFEEFPEFLNVVNKLNVAKMDYTFFENSMPSSPITIYENKDMEAGELYETSKKFPYGVFLLRTYFDKTVEISPENLEILKYICEIAYLGISRVKLVQNSIYYLIHDELTGINNHNYFMRHLAKVTKERNISDYAALYLNIRNCRYLNSIFGHKVTNQIIITLANTLNSMTSKEDDECASRLGGDFFTLIVLKKNLSKFTDILCNFPIEFDFESDHISYPLSLKAGIAELDETFDNPDAIMMGISAAHAVAKNTTIEPPIIYYTPSLIETKFINDMLAKDLENDLKASKLFVYYQPYFKYDGENKQMIGAEAMLRWKHDDTMLTASDIIPVAEKSNLILDVDLYVIEKVCKKISEWKKLGYKTVPISCNISEYDIRVNNLAQKIVELVKKYEIDFSDICLEFSESAYINEPVIMKNLFYEFKKFGIKIGIEDYSNSYLPYRLFSEADFDYIKIDYKNIDKTNPKLLLILDSIIKLSSSLDVQIILKGVGEEEIIENSINNGCNVFQGDFFEKVLSERFIENKLKNL